MYSSTSSYCESDGIKLVSPEQNIDDNTKNIELCKNVKQDTRTESKDKRSALYRKRKKTLDRENSSTSSDIDSDDIIPVTPCQNINQNVKNLELFKNKRMFGIESITTHVTGSSKSKKQKPCKNKKELPIIVCTESSDTESNLSLIDHISVTGTVGTNNFEKRKFLSGHKSTGREQKQHLKIRTLKKKSKEKKNISKIVSRYKQTSESKKLLCEICDKYFVSKLVWENHVISHFSSKSARSSTFTTIPLSDKSSDLLAGTVEDTQNCGLRLDTSTIPISEESYQSVSTAYQTVIHKLRKPNKEPGDEQFKFISQSDKDNSEITVNKLCELNDTSTRNESINSVSTAVGKGNFDTIIKNTVQENIRINILTYTEFNKLCVNETAKEIEKLFNRNTPYKISDGKRKALMNDNTLDKVNLREQLENSWLPQTFECWICRMKFKSKSHFLIHIHRGTHKLKH